MDIKDKEELFKKIMVNLAKIYGIKDYLDISVSNSKGLIKLAYSYDGGNISLPLTDSQFNNFKPEMVTFKNVLKNITIKNRGLLIREWGYSEDKLKENVIKFIKEFSE